MRSIFKLFVLALALLLGNGIAHAQHSPVNSQFEQYSQMWNTANTYNNTVLGNYGFQYDTVVTTGQIQLSIAKWHPGIVATDTAQAAPVNGYGKITLTIAGTKVTNNDSVNVQPVESLDGINWGMIPGIAAFHLVCTSTTIPTVTHILVGDKNARYYGLQVTGLGSVGSVSLQSWYYFNKAFTLYQSTP